MNVIFHHIPRTGGTFIRDAILEYRHKINVLYCYTNEDVKKILEMVDAGKDGFFIFGHKASLICPALHDRYYVDLAFWRDPVDICVSEWGMCKRSSDHHKHEAAMSSKSALEFCTKTNSRNHITRTLKGRVPSKLLSFNNFKESYMEMCEAIKIKPLYVDEVIQGSPYSESLMDDRLINLNMDDYSFIDNNIQKGK